MTGRSRSGVLVPPARSFLDTCCLDSGCFDLVTSLISYPTLTRVVMLFPEAPPSPQADASEPLLGDKIGEQ